MRLRSSYVTSSTAALKFVLVSQHVYQHLPRLATRERAYQNPRQWNAYLERTEKTTFTYTGPLLAIDLFSEQAYPEK